MLTALRHISARLRAFFRSRDLDRDFAQELASHIAMLTEDNIRRGMSHEEARRAASRARRCAISTVMRAGCRRWKPCGGMCATRSGCSVGLQDSQQCPS
jgi:hypothetical protein